MAQPIIGAVHYHIVLGEPDSEGIIRSAEIHIYVDDVLITDCEHPVRLNINKDMNPNWVLSLNTCCRYNKLVECIALVALEKLNRLYSRGRKPPNVVSTPS